MGFELEMFHYCANITKKFIATTIAIVWMLKLSSERWQKLHCHPCFTPSTHSCQWLFVLSSLHLYLFVLSSVHLFWLFWLLGLSQPFCSSYLKRKHDNQPDICQFYSSSLGLSCWASKKSCLHFTVELFRTYFSSPSHQTVILPQASMRWGNGEQISSCLWWCHHTHD